MIGIATATGNKTNIGLIGGINAMYNIASVNEDILKEMKARNLMPSKDVSSSATITTATIKPLPKIKKIRQLQSGKKQERLFQNGIFYVTLLPITLPVMDEFTLDTAGNIPLANPNSALHLASSHAAAMEFGYRFPVWRIFTHFKLSIDYTFAGARVYEINWDKILFNSSVPEGSVIYHNHQLFANIYSNLGPAFSFLLFKQVPVEIHYQASPTFYLLTHDIIDYTYQNQIHSLSAMNTIGFSQVLAGSIHFRFLSIGVQYVFSGKNNLDFIVTKPHSQDARPTGTLQTKTLLFSLAFNFGKDE